MDYTQEDPNAVFNVIFPFFFRITVNIIIIMILHHCLMGEASPILTIFVNRCLPGDC